ncbi:MAG TPA: Hint domain-containing protein [Saprospiraceae bacterium]|nr:Hint domain-containing protein [Saprospiraceae bacterium]
MWRFLSILFFFFGLLTPIPIFSITQYDWRLVGELEVGDKVLTYHGEATVTSTEKKDGSEAVYNLEIKDLHNFLVGDVGVVVHNNYLQNLIKGVKGAKGLKGTAYEDWLHDIIPGAKKAMPKDLGTWQAREYDVFFELNGKKILGEAKSGNALNLQAWPDRRSSIKQQYDDAIAHGYEFYLFSNTKVPDYARTWLTSKGIQIVETLD